MISSVFLAQNKDDEQDQQLQRLEEQMRELQLDNENQDV